MNESINEDFTATYLAEMCNTSWKLPSEKSGLENSGFSLDQLSNGFIYATTSFDSTNKVAVNLYFIRISRF